MNDLETILSIGEPALLEQLAEECSELAQAALKLARLERGENPTPKTRGECLTALFEELADVELCSEMLYKNNLVDGALVLSCEEQKAKRWAKRIREAREEKQNE